MTTCFTCQDCDKTFNSEKALRGHTRVHKAPLYTPPKIDTRITCPHTGKRVLSHLWEGYQTRLRTCNNPKCGKVFETHSDRSGLFCSKSCSATVNNNSRGPRSAEQRQKTSEGLKAYHRSVFKEEPVRKSRPSRARPSIEPKPKFTRVSFKNCSICNSNFWFKSNHEKKYCSPKCMNEASSIRMMSKIVGESAGNFSLKQPKFTYKNITIDCDSKLETAGVVYLVDIMGATSIERCTSILNYKDPDGGHHRFLPDFYVTIDNERWIVEVKQIWKQSAGINLYNRYFHEKRDALAEFCKLKGLKSLWLDFDYDTRFHTIYRKIIKK